MSTPEALSCDDILQGRGALWQHQRGYRFGLDSLLLGLGARGFGAECVLDAGCAMAPVGLSLLLATAPQRRPQVHGVEVQPELAALARRNVAHNQMEAHYQVHQGDLRSLDRAALPRFDLLLLNPPYFGAQEGVRNPHPQRAAARHELHGALGELLAGCRDVMARRATLRLIYPARKLMQALLAARRHDLHPCRVRFLHSTVAQKAYGVLIDLKRKANEAHILPPLIIYQAPEVYTEQVQTLLLGQGPGL